MTPTTTNSVPDVSNIMANAALSPEAEDQAAKVASLAEVARLMREQNALLKANSQKTNGKPGIKRVEASAATQIAADKSTKACIAVKPPNATPKDWAFLVAIHECKSKLTEGYTVAAASQAAVFGAMKPAVLKHCPIADTKANAELRKTWVDGILRPALKEAVDRKVVTQIILVGSALLFDAREKAPIDKQTLAPKVNTAITTAINAAFGPKT